MGGCGCRASECCLKCPVDPCLLDESETVPVTNRHLAQRDEHIREFRKAGVMVYQLTKASGLSAESIWQILRN